MTARRVLVVDDDRLQATLVVKAAEAVGFRADMAGTLAEALRLVAANAYAIAVLDLSLQEHDGIELVRAIHAAGADPAVIFLSGFDRRIRQAAARLADALGLRVGGVLGKPLRIEALLDLLRLDPARPAPRAAAGAPGLGPQDLARGIAAGEIVCHYQPKISLGERRMIGVEALARWHSPRHGLVSPDLFIPMAERSGLIRQIDEAVLHRALAALPAWRARAPGFTVAVNASPATLTDLTMPERVSRLLAAAGLPPSALVLEVTESVVMADQVTAADILTRLRIRGVGLAIDDFGTGHSGLLSLLRLPFNELKIDRSFVAAMMRDPEAEKIVRIVLSLGRELDLRVTAEGIEREEVAAALAAMDCAIGQGFLFARPLAEDAVTARLDRDHADTAAAPAPPAAAGAPLAPAG